MKEVNFTHTIFVEDTELNNEFVNHVNSIKLERDFEQLNNFNKSNAKFDKLVNVELENIFLPVFTL